MFGTRGFAPPEQFGFSVTDERSDIYSLGRLLEWLYAGQDEEGLLNVVKKCCAFDPEDRYENVQQVKEALLRTAASSDRSSAGSSDVFSDGSLDVSSSGSAEDASGKKKDGKKRVIAAALTGCLICVILIALAIWKTKSGRRVSFSEPLIEEAARKNLGLEEGKPLTRDDLAKVTGLYIVADRAFSGPDEFYSAVNEMYAQGGVVHGPLSSLEDIAPMTGLEQICIASEELKEIEEIKDLENLNKLEIKHNFVEDISPVAGMSKLTSVGINDNPVRDISPLIDCPNLAFLDLCDVRSYDPSVIEKLGNFDRLDISNPTESYKYLSGKSILSLHLAWTGLSSLDDLDKVTRLEELDISHTEVTDLSKLENHTGLKTLKIAALPVRNLDVLNKLPQLETVTVSKDMEAVVTALGEVSFEIRYE